MDVRGEIFDIQRFCTHDGPGIRTTVFFKSCPLRCHWCHNPESQHREVELLFYKTKCINCGSCESVCPHYHAKEIVQEDRLRKIYCGECSFTCADHCPTGAIERVGRSVEVDELLDEVIKDIDFFVNSGGGVTLSGGEPLYQSYFCYALCSLLQQKKIHTALETSGICSAQVIERIASVTDLFLWDVKHLDPCAYRQFTQGELEISLRNLKIIDQLGKAVVLRVLFIPDLHYTKEYAQSLRALLQSLKSKPSWELIPYHHLGVSKAEALGLDIDQVKRWKLPTDEQMAQFSRWVDE